MRARSEERRHEQDVRACSLRGDQFAVIVDRGAVEPGPMSAKGAASAAVMPVGAPCARLPGIAREQDQRMTTAPCMLHLLEQRRAGRLRAGCNGGRSRALPVAGGRRREASRHH